MISVLRSLIRTLVTEEARRLKGVDPNDPKMLDKEYELIVDTAAKLMTELEAAGLSPKCTKGITSNPQGEFFVKEHVDGHTIYVKEVMYDTTHDRPGWSVMIETTGDPRAVVEENFGSVKSAKGSLRNLADKYNISRFVDINANRYGTVSIANYNL